MADAIAGGINSGISLSSGLGAGTGLKNVNTLSKATATEVAATQGGYNFTKTAATHMDEAGRMIPIQILDDIIKAPMQVLKDPQGTNALMHYSQMWKNNKLYNVEILYDKTANTIMHFKYTQKAIGPLRSIPK